MLARPSSLSRPRLLLASALGCALAGGIAAVSVAGSTGCAALPALEAAAPEIATAAAQGLAALVQAEAVKQQIPPSDPQYQQALAEAKALDAVQAASQRAVLAREKAILAALRKRPLCAPVPSPVVDAGAAPIPPPDAGPAADASAPVSPAAAGKDGGT